MLNKDISPVARYSLLGILFLSGANGLMMEIVFRTAIAAFIGCDPLFRGYGSNCIYGRAGPRQSFIRTYGGQNRVSS